MRPQIVLLLALAVFLFNGVQSFAQTKGPPAPNTTRMTPPPVELPIDNNIIFLIVAGVVLGIYYAYRLNSAKKKAA